MLHQVFHYEPVLALIAKNLSLKDLFCLAMVNRHFYYKWSKSNRIVDATNLRSRVQTRMNRAFKKKSPFLGIRKEFGKLEKKKTFKCFGGCGKVLHKKWMMNLSVFRLPICSVCAKGAAYTFQEVLGWKIGSFFQFPELHWMKTRVYFKPDQNIEVLTP